MIQTDFKDASIGPDLSKASFYDIRGRLRRKKKIDERKGSSYAGDCTSDVDDTLRQINIFAPQFGQFGEQERFWPHQRVPAVWTATPDSMII